MFDHPDSDSPIEPPGDSEASEEQTDTSASRDADGDPEATFVGPFSVEIPGQGTEETFVEDIQDAMTTRAHIFLKPKIAKRLWEKFLGDGLLTTEGFEDVIEQPFPDPSTSGWGVVRAW